ncbi:Aip5 protein [Martiniozyma asiatica (nom. inval.)]|nr:Aip5 protein [Martiniozyma asiatica]
MDFENELDQFKKKNAPALVGSSIRGSTDEELTPSSESPVRPIIRNTESKMSILTVDDLREEGGLVNDEDSQLDEILDNSGHLKDDVLPDHAKLPSSGPSISTPASTTQLNPVSVSAESNKVSILGGGADEYFAPAGGSSSGYKYSAKKKNSVISLDQNDSSSIIEPEKMKSVDDIIAQVNKGKFEDSSKAANSKKSLLDDQLTKAMNDLKELDFKDSEVPDSSIEIDSDFTPPAAKRNGSTSKLSEEQRSKSKTRPSLKKEGTGTHQPHLARGDSYHGGLNDENVHHPINSNHNNSKSDLNERKPRHDPSGPKIANQSSLSYLRSISRSRSRAANDRRALGEDMSMREENLKEQGALTNFSEETATTPSYEEAVAKAIHFVQETNNHKQEILDEVQEEDEASSRTMNTDDLLDQLANSAHKLMTNEDEAGDEEDEEVEELNENFEKDVDEEEKEEEVQQDNQSVLDESKEVKIEKDTDLSGEEKDKEKEIATGEVDTDEVDKVEDKEAEEEEAEGDDEVEEEDKEDEDKEEEKEEEEEEEEEEETHKKEELEEAEDKEEEDDGEEEEEEEQTEPLSISSKEIKETNEEQTENKLEEEVKDVTENEGQEPEEEKEDDDIEALLAAAAAEQAQKATENTTKGDSVYVPKAGKMTFEDEPVYLYTSFAGGFQVHTRTNRLVTILTANRVAYTMKDLGTDEEAKKVWRRYSGGKSLPGIVRGKDDFIGNWEDIEEANEDYAVRSLIFESY